MTLPNKEEVKGFEEAIRHCWRRLRKSAWWLQVAFWVLVLAFLALKIFEWRSSNDTSALKATVAQLTASATSREATVGDLRHQNDQLLATNLYLLSNFQKIQSIYPDLSLAAAISRAVDDIEGLKLYSMVARYNARGNASGEINGVPVVATPINNWNEQFLTRVDGALVWNAGVGAREACDDVIKKVPSYPFGYYFRALTKKQNSDASWKEDMAKAISILEKTTDIVGHHSDHDKVLLEARTFLAK